jgi:hypothetical protein
VTSRKGLREPDGCHDRTDDGPNQHVRILDEGAACDSLRYLRGRRHQAAQPNLSLLRSGGISGHVARRRDRLDPALLRPAPGQNGPTTGPKQRLPNWAGDAPVWVPTSGTHGTMKTTPAIGQHPNSLHLSPFENAPGGNRTRGLRLERPLLFGSPKRTVDH